MADSGTNFLASPELLVPGWEIPGPRRARLEAGLRDSVRAGRLRPGVRLPSSRALSAALGVSRRLVVEAYEQLAAEGYLVSAPGSGTRVAPGGRADVPADIPAAVPAPATSATPVRIDLFP